jgi:hypothetical protein
LLSKVFRKLLNIFVVVIVVGLFLYSIVFLKVVSEKTQNSLEINFNSLKERFVPYCTRKILRINNEGISLYNIFGKFLWEIKNGNLSFFADVNGKYIMLCAGNRKNLYLYKGKKLIKIIKTENEIIIAKLGKSGKVLVVTSELGTKGRVMLFNKKAKILYSWISSFGNILDATISNNEKFISISVMDIKEKKIFSTVFVFNVKDQKLNFEVCQENVLIARLKFDKSSIIVASDSGISSFDKFGKVRFKIDFTDSLIKEINFENESLLTLLTESCDGYSKIDIYLNNGKKIGNYKQKGKISNVEVVGRNIIFNSFENIIMVSFEGKIRKAINIPYSPNGICLIKNSSSILIVGNTRANIVNLNHKNKFKEIVNE